MTYGLEVSVATRWESVALVIGSWAVALWALSAPEPMVRGQEPQSAVRTLLFEIRRPGARPERASLRGDALLGRSRDCTIVFDDSAVSKWHARVHFDGGQPTIEDLHSTNGTLVNGHRIEGTVPVRRGDRIGLGSNQMVFVGLGTSPRNREH
ncbi:MAG: FHA domain-containing protein [Candidatus Eremiobacteraeota bacterium]|nr:FHA domain-containing protein [Candidatus Eremiobacteraeota bacterium]MBC5826126.1 FHA domain-containing protein [Candidatus Eremiobacteraeota bacterium]